MRRPTMRWPLLLLMSAPLQAQPPMPIGIVRGNLVARTASDITVRTNGASAACFYDAHTYFERERNPVAPTGLYIGDPVEVVADRQPGSAACYARTVQVIDSRPRKRLPRIESPSESLAPRGDLLFGGVVLRRTANKLTLKTQNGEQTLVLRPDARYWCDGMRSAANALAVNTRVFVHAGRDSEGNVEVYQASWGAVFPAP